MTVKRIVPNITATRVVDAVSFYRDVLGLVVVMDQGWTAAFASNGVAAPQISVATEGGSGTAVPDFSIEVDNFEEVMKRMLSAGLPHRVWSGPRALGRSTAPCARPLRPVGQHPDPP